MNEATITPLLVEAAIWLAKSTVIFAIAGLLCFTIRRQSAALRHSILNLSLIAALLLPIVDSQFPDYIGLKQASSPAVAPSSITINDPLFQQNTIALPVVTPARIEPPAPGKKSFSISWPVTIAAIWIIGTTILIVRLLLSACALSWLRHKSFEAPADLEMRFEIACRDLDISPARVRLILSKGNRTPMTWGLFKAVVLLPEQATSWETAQIHSVLLHELAHVRRADFLWDTVARTLVALQWVNPFAWLALAGLDRERERACDADAVSAGVPQQDYARHLLFVVAQSNPSRFLAAGSAMARCTRIEGRLRAILNLRVKKSSPITACLTGGLVLLITGLTTVFGDEVKPGSVLEPQASELRAIDTVIIDAGHGGPDEGGSIDGIDEKDIALQLAIALGKALETTPLKIVYTRDTDRYLSLSKRVALAKKHPNGILISLHANTAESPGMRGVETYISPAPSPANTALALALHAPLIRETGLEDRGIRRKKYAILKSSLPSALLGIGFMTNPEDLALLQDPAYQQKVANALADGINTYVKLTRSDLTQQELSDQYLSGYLKFREGEKEEESGSSESALKNYKNAQASFQAIQSEDAKFKPTLVKSRIEKTAKKIKKLNQKSDAQKRIEQKLQTIVMPEFSIEDATIAEAIQELTSQMLAHDQSIKERGLNLIMEDDPDDRERLAKQESTLKLNDVSAKTALDFLVNLWGLSYRIDDTAIVITSAH